MATSGASSEIEYMWRVGAFTTGTATWHNFGVDNEKSEYLLEDWLPKYTEDLNAMHKAEKVMIFSKRKTYRKNLQIVMSESLEDSLIDMSEIYRAKAYQRAKAFLMTFGKWEDEDG
jgi:hypothetical protein